MGKNQHVVPDKNGGWNVKGAGNSKATKHFDTKQPATDYARKISQNQGSECHHGSGRHNLVLGQRVCHRQLHNQ